MRKLGLAFTVVGLAAGLFAQPAWASSIIPGGFETVEGNVDNKYPFGISGPCSGCPLTSQRYQQVYAASDFSGSFWIQEIVFRPDGEFGEAFASTLGNIRVDLSTTSAAVDGLSQTFANNVGANNTTVFSGPLSLSSLNTGVGPRTFDIRIVLATPFLYDSSAGNLLLDVWNFNAGITTFLDAHIALGDGISRVYSTDVTGLRGEADSLGLVTMFNGQVVPEPSTFVLLGGGLLALAARLRRRA